MCVCGSVEPFCNKARVMEGPRMQPPPSKTNTTVHTMFVTSNETLHASPHPDAAIAPWLIRPLGSISNSDLL